MENPMQPGGIISPSQQPTNLPVESQASMPQPDVYPSSSAAPMQPFTDPSAVPEMPNRQPIGAPLPAQPMPAFMNPGPAIPPPPGPQVGMPAMPVPQKPSKKKRLTLPLIIIAAVVLLGGGSAAAYFGYVVPNKPENKLLSAITNLASQKNVTTSGDITYGGDSGGVSLKYKIAANTEKSEMAASGTLGVSGIQAPFEARYIDKDIYIKVGGLDTLANLIPAGSSFDSYASTIKNANNQWYVIDSSFVQSLGFQASCVSDVSFNLTDSDIALIKSAYKKHPLFKIKGTSNVTVDGVATTKYDVDPASDKDASAFAGDLTNLSIVKKIKACAGSSADSLKSTFENQTKDTATGTLAMYVTKDKQLKKIELTTKDSGSNISINANFSYAAVSVEKPADAKSIADLYAAFTGQAVGDISIVQTKAKDVERQTDINAIRGQVEAYWAQKGYYPSLSDLNSPAFVSANLKGLDTAAFQDPDGTSKILLAAPKKGSYAYAVTPANCNNTTTTANQCQGYTLTATLDDGSLYTKKALND